MNVFRSCRIIVCFSFFLSLNTISAADRVAFIIGNDSYQGVPLDNAIRDALAIKEMLTEKLGFLDSDVVYIEDVDEITLREEFEVFKMKASNAKIVLFFYAGHGMESLDGKENFIIPIDADLGKIAQSEAALKASGIGLMSLTAELADHSNGAKIVLMDACRQRPAGRGFSRSGGGLAIYADDRIPADTLMILAAAPKRLASDGERHGPFTAALLDVLPQGSDNLMASFFAVSDRVQQITNRTQVPWLKFDGSGKIFRENTFLPSRPVNDTDLSATPHAIKEGEVGLTATDLQLPHRWVNENGKEIDAVFQMISGQGFESKVVLKTADGKVGEVLLVQLSDQSQKMARDLEFVRNKFVSARKNGPENTINTSKSDQNLDIRASAKGLLSSNLDNTKWSWGPVSDGRIRYFFSDQTEMSSWASADPGKYEVVDSQTIKIHYSIGGKAQEIVIEFDDDFRSFKGRSTFSGSVEGTFLGPIDPADPVLNRR